jgi:ribosome-binding ATPase
MIIGLVGKPSSGKSTTFRALTLSEVAIGAYPFTTIGKNEGVAFVKLPDVAREFGKISNPREGFVLDEFRFSPVKLIDVAGIVPGAHEGKGLGLQFLDDLRQADALIHVVDCSGSTNEKGESVEPGAHDPCADVRFLENELDQWYLGILKKSWQKFSRSMQQVSGKVYEAIAKQMSGLNVTEDAAKYSILKLKLPEKPQDWTEQQMLALARDLRLATKPMLIAANKMDLPTSSANLAKLKETFPDLHIVACTADLELALREATKKELIKYVPGSDSFEIIGNLEPNQQKGLDYIAKTIKDLGSSGIQEAINHSVFNLLKYMAIFPGGVNNLVDKDGNVLPDVFLMPQDSTALDFAFKLHTDLGNGFIKAIDVRTKRAVGKDHKLKNLDIFEIVSR